MKSQNKNFLKHLTFVFIFSYLLNFLWESIHAYILYKEHDILASKYVPMMLYVSLIDAILICAIVIIGFIVFKRMLSSTDIKEILFISIVGFIFASIIELKALYFKQWSYLDIMPTIFGMGISPLIQLPITGVVSIYLASSFSSSQAHSEKL